MAEGGVTLTAYGVGTANDADVVFPLEEALPAARAVWNLAQQVGSRKWELVTASAGATAEWKGPHRDVFDAKVDTYKGSADSEREALKALARGIAAAWAAARGQQNRINKARHDDHARQNEGARGWGVVEFFAGEVDYGPPPDNPPPPSPPGFAATAERMFPEWGP